MRSRAPNCSTNTDDERMFETALPRQKLCAQSPWTAAAPLPKSRPERSRGPLAEAAKGHLQIQGNAGKSDLRCCSTISRNSTGAITSTASPHWYRCHAISRCPDA